MKCINCGHSTEENFVFCPNCGTKCESGSDTNTTSTVTQKVLNCIKSPLYLTFCILISASAVIGLGAERISILSILLSVFSWLFYASGKKEIADSKMLRNISGTIYAKYIINLILIGFIALLSILIGILCALSRDTLISAILNETGDINLDSFDIIPYLTGSFAIYYILGFAISLIIISIVLFLFTVKGTRSIHRFVKSTYQCIDNGVNSIEKPINAKNWLLVFGIFEGILAINSIGNFESFLSSGSLSAAYIIANIMISKYFIDTNFNK